jgi:hypothetical protein
MSCEEMDIEPIEKKKTGCYCNDGTYVKWDENIMRQTGWTTGNPCWDKGGIREFTYGY